MDKSPNNQTNAQWVRTNYLMVDLPSMEKGFLEREKYRQDIWDYVLYRESLVQWPSLNEKIKMGIGLK